MPLLINKSDYVAALESLSGLSVSVVTQLQYYNGLITIIIQEYC